MRKATKKSTPKYTIQDWMESIEDMIEYGHSHSEELCVRINRLRIAVWALTIYNVVFAALFLVLLYGNQYLIK